MNWKIPLYKISTDSEDIKNIKKVLERKMDWAIGPEIKQFEKKLAKYVGSKFCVAFNSGTSAGHAALLAGNINSGNIIVPSLFIIISVLLISKIPTYSFKRIVVPRSTSIFLLFGIILYFGLLLIYTFNTIIISGIIYLLMIPASSIHYLFLKKQNKEKDDGVDHHEDIL